MSDVPSETFKPLLFTELLDRTFRLYRSNFLQFIGILAVMQIPVQLLNLAINLLSATPAMERLEDPSFLVSPDTSYLYSYFFTAFAGSCIVGIVTIILVNGVANGTLSNAVLHAYLGRPLGIRDAYAGVKPILGRLIVVVLLGWLITIALVIWMLVPCVGWLTGFGMLLFFSWVLQTLAIPVAVVERASAARVFRRAWQLARRRFWWVLGFVGAMMFISVVVTSGPSYIVGLLLGLIEQALVLTETQAFVMETAVQTLVGLTVGLLYAPLMQTGITLLYLDLRVRTEGLDMVMRLSDPASGIEGKWNALTEVSAGDAPDTLLKWKELGYLALLSLAGLVLIVGLYVLMVLFGAALLLAIGGMPLPG
ncbi:MAG: hypothetical protein ACK2UB_04115 [Anaerolineales bacterium]